MDFSNIVIFQALPKKVEVLCSIVYIFLFTFADFCVILSTLLKDKLKKKCFV